MYIDDEIYELSEDAMWEYKAMFEMLCKEYCLDSKNEKHIELLKIKIRDKANFIKTIISIK